MCVFLVTIILKTLRERSLCVIARKKNHKKVRTMKNFRILIILIAACVMLAFTSCEEEKDVVKKSGLQGHWKAQSICTAQLEPCQVKFRDTIDDYYVMNIIERQGDSILLDNFSYHNPVHYEPNLLCPPVSTLHIIESHIKNDSLVIHTRWGLDNWIFTGKRNNNEIHGYLRYKGYGINTIYAKNFVFYKK